MTLRILYGGTFDPVHAGHLAVARAARDTLGATVQMVPAAVPPHRGPTAARAQDRAELLDLAVAGEPGLAVDTRELRRHGPSYTADTLREARAEFGPRAPLAWLVGADAFRGLPGWHDWRALFELAHLVVAVRPGHGLEELPDTLSEACEGRWTTAPAALSESAAGCLFRLDLPPHPAAASELRRRLAAGEDPGDWLPPSVAAEIARRGLYRAA
ncbi:nicotinate-nucleotide adenylyltransferase [Arenimonas aestuarii]